MNTASQGINKKLNSSDVEVVYVPSQRYKFITLSLFKIYNAILQENIVKYFMSGREILRKCKTHEIHQTHQSTATYTTKQHWNYMYKKSSVKSKRSMERGSDSHQEFTLTLG